jgi:hypothetical protein
MDGIRPPHQSSLTPQHYLDFAEQDRRGRDERARINAFGNVKRAFHLAVDTALHQYGLLAFNQRLNFPAKLQLLDTSGILSINILKRLNIERNLIEHEYAVPEVSAVDDAIDVARLLILAFSQLNKHIAVEWMIGLREPKCHALCRLSQQDGSIEMFRLKNGRNRYATYNGIRFFNGALRRPFDRAWVGDNYTFGESPFKRIELRAGNADNWRPIVDLMIYMQRSYDSSADPDGQNMISVGSTIVVPLRAATDWKTALGELVK